MEQGAAAPATPCGCRRCATASGAAGAGGPLGDFSVTHLQSALRAFPEEFAAHEQGPSCPLGAAVAAV